MTGSQEITHFSVEGFNEADQKWLTINDRIKVAEYMKSGVNKDVAIKKARDEAEHQASGWGAAYPLRRYRAVPVYGSSW